MKRRFLLVLNCDAYFLNHVDVVLELAFINGVRVIASLDYKLFDL